MWHVKICFITPFDTLDFSIQGDNNRNYIDTALKYWDQIDTIEMLGIKLKYSAKDRNQLCNLPLFLSKK